MGLCASQNSSIHRDVIAPQGEYHQQIEQEFAEFLSLDNVNNVNHKYSYLYTPNKENFVGKGVKKTHAYTAKVDERKNFPSPFSLYLFILLEYILHTFFRIFLNFLIITIERFRKDFFNGLHAGTDSRPSCARFDICLL